MLVIYGTLKNCNKKIGSPCLFSLCEPVILGVFSLLALEMFETLTTIKNSYFVAKTIFFQLSVLKLSDLEKR